MNNNHTGGNKTNWRKRFFYAAEIVFAIIAGTGEAAIYYAYTPPGPWRWPEALARAFITQVAIIFFGVAAVEASASVKKLWAKFLAAMPANIATAVFSLVAFWFMRDAAIIFRDGSVLGPAEGVTYALPNGYTLTGQTIDVYLIASLPIFQVGLNWLSPIITREKNAEYETEEQRSLREASELADAEHKARLAKVKAQQNAVKAAGLRGTFQAALGQVNPLDEPAQNDATSPDGMNGSVIGSTGDNPVDMSEQNTGKDAAISGGKSGGSGRAKPGQSGLREVATGQWTATDLREYIARRYDEQMEDERAVQVLSTMPGVQRLRGVRGNPYAAPKATVKAWADRQYKARQDATQGMEQTARFA